MSQTYEGNPKTYVIKVGGSVFDKEKAEPQKRVLEKLCSEIVGLFLAGHRLVLTCGGGPVMDLFKDRREAYDLSDAEFAYQAEQAVDANCRNLEGLLRKEIQNRKKKKDPSTQNKGVCPIVREEALLGITQNGSLHTRIPIVSYATVAAKYIFAKDIPRIKSDVHTLAIAEFIARYEQQHRKAYGGIEIHFIKDTTALHAYDPNRTDLPQGNEVNPPIKMISARDYLECVDRTGTDGRGDHLLEDDAARFFGDKTKTRLVDRIRIYSHTPPGNVRKAIESNAAVGSVIVNENFPGYETYILKKGSTPVPPTSAASNRLKKAQ